MMDKKGEPSSEDKISEGVKQRQEDAKNFFRIAKMNETIYVIILTVGMLTTLFTQSVSVMNLFMSAGIGYIVVSGIYIFMNRDKIKYLDSRKTKIMKTDIWIYVFCIGILIFSLTS